MSQPRIAVLGAGAWGINHVRVLAHERTARLVAVADPDPTALPRVAAVAPAARHVRSHEEVLAAPDVDAVVIATPASTHAALACAALDAGKDILVEKPFAMSVAEVARIRAAQLRSGRVVMVGHLMVFHPAVVQMRKLLHGGSLGQLHYLHATRANLGQLRRDENALWSFGPHDLSMLDFLLERTPVNVAARGHCVLQPGIEDVVFLSLRYDTGAMAHLHLSWLHPRKERRLTLVCARKMLEFDDVAPDKLRIYDKGFERPPSFTEFAQYLTIRDGDVHIPQLAMEEPLRLELRHFIDCVVRRATPITDLTSAERVTRVLEVAQRSLAADGAPMTLSEPVSA